MISLCYTSFRKQVLGLKASVETHILRILLVCILLLLGLILWVNLSPHLPDTTSVDVQSESYVIMRFEDGEILSSKEKDAQIYPASMTKMMTAILAIENYEDLEEVIEVPYSIFPALYAQDASRAGFEPGERVPYRDILYGILLPSGCECCETAAYLTAGSDETFVEWMNEKAASLGMDHTHFANATGLHDSNHYTTTYDLALLLRYCLQNETFYEVFTTSSYLTTPSNIHPEGMVLRSTMREELSEISTGDIEILGGKTGFTSFAGLCLASLGEVDGERYIVVNAGAPGDHGTEPYHILDAITLYQSLA